MRLVFLGTGDFAIPSFEAVLRAGHEVLALVTQPDREKGRGQKLTAPPITGTNQGAEHIPRAPRSLIETTRIFQKSEIARDWFGDLFVDHFAATREWEHPQWQDAVTDWEMKRYFEII